MIQGRITPDQQAIVELSVLGPSGAHQSVEVMLDTGFNGHLKLPPTVISTLGLRYQRDALVMLADGSVTSMQQYQGWVEWHGAPERSWFWKQPEAL